MAQELENRVVQVMYPGTTGTANSEASRPTRVSWEIYAVKQWPIHIVLEGRVRLYTGYVQGRNSYQDIVCRAKRTENKDLRGKQLNLK